jgi:hypothetical protein
MITAKAVERIFPPLASPSLTRTDPYLRAQEGRTRVSRLDITAGEQQDSCTHKTPWLGYNAGQPLRTGAAFVVMELQPN